MNELEFDWEPDATAWDNMYSELVRYKEEHGNFSVPRKLPETKKLAAWVTKQRRDRHKLSSYRVERLNALNFDWEVRNALWELMYSKLVRYKEEHGDCNVSQGWSEDPQLGSWVRTQRGKRDKLSANRMDRLTALGFDWDPDNAQWDQMYKNLVRYKAEHGNCNVPARWTEDQKLATWITYQRTKRDELPSNRLKRLIALGFEWDLRAIAWDRMYSELCRYQEKHGDCNVPQAWSGNPELGRWVGRQRTNARNGKLSEDRRQRLEAIGFSF